MYISPDDAKSDVILAGATLLFGGLARTIVAQLPLYPRQGVLALLLDLGWLVLLTAAVPWWLSRYRGDGLAAFGLDGDRSALGGGVLLAVPIIVVSVIATLLMGFGIVTALLGDVGRVLAFADGQVALLASVSVARFVLLTVGATLVVSFLAVRSREAFPRSPDTSLTELVRTFGMGAAGVALIIGLLRSITPTFGIVSVLLHVPAVVAIVLLADRKVPARVAVPRATVIAPAIIVLVVHIFAFGGFFRGDLAAGLYSGALGAAITIAISALAQLRGVAWAIVPLLAAAHWWSGPFSPLPF